MRKQLLISFAILLFLFIGTALVIIYGKGYQINFQGGKPEIEGTGLLVVTSNPDGAAVYINDHPNPTTATNNTISLPPGEYKVTISKEGYFSWTKEIKVQKEVVSKATALLIPSAPRLESITDTGINNPVLDPSKTKIAFTVASQSAKKNGVYVLNMNTSSILTLQSSSTQIADDTTDLFSKANLSWSPDGQNIVATVTANTTSTTYLLNATSFNATPQDVTATIGNITSGWATDIHEKALAQINSLKPTLRKFVEDNFTILAWSPDETKILYAASNSAQLPFVINPPLIGTDSTNQDRNLEQNKIYVYDIKEDKNFLINTGDWKYDPSQVTTEQLPLMWTPDSLHLLFVHDKRIDLMEYDGGNNTTVYAGPFIDTSVFPWPDGSKFVVLTNLGNTDITPNLYTVSLK